MALRTIRIQGDPVLTKVCRPIPEVTDRIRTLAEDMLETMYEANGVGLAAPQVGILKRMAVIDIGDGQGPFIMINPEIIESSKDTSVYQEGCLSFPDQYSDVERPKSVTIRYLDEHGAEKTMEADEILATCLQHEIDHTNGVVFVDHISLMKRDMILRKLKKAKRLGMFEPQPEPVPNR